MKTTAIAAFAQELMEAHGSKAEAEAAQKAVAAENAGNAEEAQNWRKVRAAISQMRGPHES